MTHTVTFTTPASEAEMREIIRRVAVDERHGRPEDDSSGWDVVKLGYRVSFRLWGIWGTHIERRLPIELKSKVGTQDGTTVVSLLFSNDEGPYLFSPTDREGLFGEVFLRIASRIRSLTP